MKCDKCKWSNANATRCYKLFEQNGFSGDRITPTKARRCTQCAAKEAPSSDYSDTTTDET